MEVIFAMMFENKNSPKSRFTKKKNIKKTQKQQKNRTHLQKKSVSM